MSVLAINPEFEQLDEQPQPRNLPPSMVERITLILDAFETPSSRLTLEQVSKATHLPRSTAHRILDQLVRLDWLSHSPFGYSLGGRALGLGGPGSGHVELREAAAETLHRLQVTTGLVVHLAVLEGAEISYLDKVGGRFASAVPSRVGGRAPAHCTGLGKAMLAWLDAEQVDQTLGNDISRHTSNSICDRTLLHHELRRIRERKGLAFERGECFPEISCVAAAVRGPEGPVGAISMVGDAQTPLERVAPLVIEASRHVSQQLYPQAAPVQRRPHAVPTDAKGWSPRMLDQMMAATTSDWL